ncbi:hypothetical protein E2562_022775 [Oryza meyeriana var. granulata]|uniref:Uncharacterized protein n=1 Tax=Oryza meyeriana var. granulata TaxID=110450 RepID=A0A6G1FBA2_9ORYZ|nr:hypothetical protein E2562_022775 [Oryza meyeriana var. granulata]
MRLQAEAELAGARAYNTDGKANEDVVHDEAVDAKIRESSMVESMIIGESLATDSDHFTDSGSVRYVIDSLANNTIVPDSHEETDAKEKN